MASLLTGMQTNILVFDLVLPLKELLRISDGFHDDVCTKIGGWLRRHININADLCDYLGYFQKCIESSYGFCN